MSNSFVKDCTDASTSGASNSSNKTLIIIVNNESGNVPIGGEEIQNLLASHGAGTSEVSVLQMGSGANPPANPPYIPTTTNEPQMLQEAPLNFMGENFPNMPIEDSSGYDEIPLDPDTLQSLEKVLKSKEAKDILGGPLLDMVEAHSNSIGTFDIAGSSSCEEQSISGIMKKCKKSPTRRSQRQMDKVEREEVEKIRAENRQMLQQEREELLKAQEEREAIELGAVQASVDASKPKVSAGKGKGKASPTQSTKGPTSKGKGKRIASKGDSQSEGEESDRESDKDSSHKPGSKNPHGRVRKDSLLKDIKMKSLTVNVERLDLPPSNQNQDDDDSPNEEKDRGSNTDEKVPLPDAKTSKEESEAFPKVKSPTSNSHDSLSKSGDSAQTDRHTPPPPYTNTKKSSVEAPHAEIKKDENDSISTSNNQNHGPEASGTVNNVQLPKVITTNKRDVDVSNPKETQKSNDVIHHASDESSAKSPTISSHTTPKKSDEHSMKTDGDSSIKKVPEKFANDVQVSKDTTPKTKPVLVRNNILSISPDKSLPQTSQASILAKSPSISKSLMNYKIPFKNPQRKRLPFPSSNPNGTNSSTVGNNPPQIQQQKGLLKQNPVSNLTPSKNQNENRKTLEHKTQFGAKMKKTSGLPTPKSKEKKFFASPPDSKNILKNGQKSAKVFLSGNASDIRRSKRPAKKKTFGDDFLHDKSQVEDKEDNSDFEESKDSSAEESLSEEEIEEEEEEEEANEYDEDPDRLWCICQKPHHNRFMICCDRCEDWFHGSCVGVTKAMGKQWELQDKEWICPNCKKVEKAIRGQISPDKAASKSDKNVEIQIVDEKISANKYKNASVLVYDKKTGNVLSGSQAPTLDILPDWLEKNPTYATVSREMMELLVVDPKTGLRKMPFPLPDDDDEEYVPEEVKPKTFYGSPKKKHFSKEGSLKKKKTKLLDHSMLTPQSTKKSHFAPLSTSKDSKKKLSLSIKTPKNELRRESLSSPITPREKLELSRKNSRDDTPSRKEKKHKTHRSEMETPSPKINFPSIRSSVRNVLFETLEKRKSEATQEFKNLTQDAIKEICKEIEQQLYYTFNKEVGFKYKSRYRSLIFNIKDPKNGGLFRQILNGAIPPTKLVNMTSEELASKELAEWREKEEKKELEAIQKHELEMLALGNQYIMKSHKGEIMIDKDDFIKSKETATETVNNLPAEKVEELTPEEHEEDIINSHKNHIYDPNCKICLEEELKTYKQTIKDESNNKENLDISQKRERTESESSSRHHKKHKKDKDRHRHSSDSDRHHKHSKSKHKDKHSSDESHKHRSRHKSGSSGKHKDKRRDSLDRRESESDDHKHSNQRNSEGDKRRHHRKDSEGNSSSRHRRDSRDDKRKHDRDRRRSSESSHRKRKHSEMRNSKTEVSEEYQSKHKDITRLSKYSESFEDSSSSLPSKQDDGNSSDSKPEVSTSEDVVFYNSSSHMPKTSADVEPTSTGSPFPTKGDYSSPSSSEEEVKLSLPNYPEGSPSTPPLPEPAFDLDAIQAKVEETILSTLKMKRKRSSPPSTPPPPTEVEHDLLSPATPPLPDEEDRLTPPPLPPQPHVPHRKSLPIPIWKGIINMPEVGKFNSAAFEVSGKARYFTGDVPSSVEIVGRISPDAVWPYIAQMKKTGSKEILVTRFQPSSEVERASYIALYSYLSSKKRYGVVGHCGKSVKDFYIIPLAAHQPIPQVLLPLDGPGFEESRPHMLIGVIVRIKRRRTYDPASGVWIDDGTMQQTKKRGSIDDDASLISPVDEESDDRSYTPPPALHQPKKPKKESLNSNLSPSIESDKIDSSTQKRKGSSPSDRDSMLAELNRQIERERQELSEMQKTVDETMEECGSHTPPGTPPPNKDSSNSTLDTSKIHIPSNLHEILDNIKKKEDAINEKEMELKRRLNIAADDPIDIVFKDSVPVPDPDPTSKDVDLRVLMHKPMDPAPPKDEDMRLFSNQHPIMGLVPPPPLEDTDFRMRDPRVPIEGEFIEDMDGMLSKMSDSDLVAKALEMEVPPSELPPQHFKHKVSEPDPRNSHPANLPYAIGPGKHPPGHHPHMEGGFPPGPMPPFEQFGHGSMPPPFPEDSGPPPHGQPFGPPRRGGGRPPGFEHPEAEFVDPNFPPHPPPRFEKGRPFRPKHPLEKAAAEPPYPQRPPPHMPREDWQSPHGHPPPPYWNDMELPHHPPENWDHRPQEWPEHEGIHRPPFDSHNPGQRRPHNYPDKPRGGDYHRGMPRGRNWQRGRKQHRGRGRGWHHNPMEGGY